VDCMKRIARINQAWASKRSQTRSLDGLQSSADLQHA
jgi:hypothetical protein